jgi:hypothetical protein
MTLDLPRILESKRALCRNLARGPVAETLAMLDTSRDRLRAIRRAAVCKRSMVLRARQPNARFETNRTVED